MNVLLDTHALLWWLDDEATLSREAHDVISDATNPVFLSAAVIWEIRIKQRLGIDIGRPSQAFPVTPPCVRVRTRRFGSVKQFD